jgi:hypothetical protein
MSVATARKSRLLAWQELTLVLRGALQQFLEEKSGILGTWR